MADFKILPTVNGTAVSLVTHNHTGVYQLANGNLDDFAMVSLSSYMFGLLEEINAADARTYLGLAAAGAGDIWVEKTGDTMSGQLNLDHVLNLSSGTQDYHLVGDTTTLVLMSQTSGVANALRLETLDADGTDNVAVEMWGRGKVGNNANRERLMIMWDAATSLYTIKTESAGTGVARALSLFTGSNTDQLNLLTNGSISMGVASQLTTTAMQFSSSIFSDAYLTTVAPAVSSRAEILQAWKLTDSTDFFAISNGTATNSQFMPTFLFRNISANPQSLFFSSETITTNDTGTNAMFILQAFSRSNTQVFTAIGTRPIFYINNLTTTLFSVLANGAIGAGTTTPQGTEANSNFTIEQSDATAVQLSIINTGAGQATVMLRRTGTTPSRWGMYIPATVDQLRIYSGTLVNDVAVFLATGHIGVGIATPTLLGSGGTARILQIHNPGTAANSFGMLNLTTGSTAIGVVGTIAFGVPSLSGTDKRVAQIVGAKADALTVNPVGSLSFGVSNGVAPVTQLTITPATTTIANLITSSAGITFGGSTLSDYIATTSFTPTITSPTPPTSISYTTQKGYYFVIGSMCFVYYDVTVNAISGGTGSARFNLPIVPAATPTSSNVRLLGTAVISFSYVQKSYQVVASQQYVTCNPIDGPPPFNALSITSVANGSNYHFEGWYFI